MSNLSKICEFDEPLGGVVKQKRPEGTFVIRGWLVKVARNVKLTCTSVTQHVR
jgi:hypothetical protein